MKFILQFDMDNAAFDILPHDEAVNVLTAALAALQSEGFDDKGRPAQLRDSNGDTIGAWGLASTAEEMAGVLGAGILDSLEQRFEDAAERDPDPRLTADREARATAAQRVSFKREPRAVTQSTSGPLEVVFSQIDPYKDDGRDVRVFATAQEADRKAEELSGGRGGDNYFPGRYTLKTPEEAAEAFHAERVHPSELKAQLTARGWYKSVVQQTEAMHRAKKGQRFDFGVGR